MFTPSEIVGLVCKIVITTALAVFAGAFFNSVFFVTVFSLAALSMSTCLIIFGLFNIED